MSFKVAVLLTNNDTSAFSWRFPNDAEKVVSKIAQVRPAWQASIWPVKDDVFPELDDADAFILTGSPASVHDALPWIDRLSSFIRELHQRSLPTIGLCFGHQLIATALGGQVRRNPHGWRFGASETAFAASPWMGPEMSTLCLFAAHSEQVTHLPPNAIRVGSAEGCPNAAYTVSRHIMTTQYHPEFDREFMEALAAEYAGDISQEILTAGRRELALPTHGPVFFDWIAKFIETATPSAREHQRQAT